MFEAVIDKVTTQGLTAGTALAAAILGPTVAIIIGRLQFRTANKQIIAPIRQKAIGSLRYCVSEVISTAAFLYRSSMNKTLVASDEQAMTIKLTLLISQAELMLDPEKESHSSVIRSLDRVRHTSFEGNIQLAKFPDAVEELKRHCRIVLRQWERGPLGSGAYD
jgi:hypothetical protein